MGRAISTGLKYNVPPEEFIEQLEGIKGSDTYGFGKDRVLSIPDAFAKEMKEILGNEVPILVEVYKKLYGNKEGQEQKKENRPGSQGKVVEEFCPLCGHASLYRNEGCIKCSVCEYKGCQ